MSHKFLVLIETKLNKFKFELIKKTRFCVSELIYLLLLLLFIIIMMNNKF
jgi:hypothetical protein